MTRSPRIRWAALALSAAACDEIGQVALPVDDPEPAEVPVLEGEDATVALGGVVVCEQPELRDEAVFDRLWIGPAVPLHTSDPVVQGLTVDDIDGDGLLDLFMPLREGRWTVVYGDPVEGFRPSDPDWRVMEEDPGPATPYSGFSHFYGTGSAAADIDADGDTDVVIYESIGPAGLLRNDGAGNLVREAIQPAGYNSVGCGGTVVYGDYDLDGDLDVFHGRTVRANRTSCASFLLENTGEGGFVDQSAMLSDELQAGHIVSAAWLQLDDDPWPELYTASIEPVNTPGNRAMDNLGGILEPYPRDHSLHISIAAMGLALADLNDDSVVDLFVPGTNEHAVLVSSPGGWYDSSEALGIVPDVTRNQHTAWAGEYADLDNDGLVDLPVVYGPIEVDATPEPDALYRQVEPGAWEDVAWAWRWADPQPSRTAIVADLDDNGFLDLVKRQETRLIVDLGRCNESGWLRVRLHQPGTGNLDAIGASVAVWADGVRYWRPVVAGGTSFGASGPAEVHFGFGDVDRVDAVEITWPDGVVSVLEGMETRQIVDVERTGWR